jgi:electron transfer flavoprotein beta subunit
VWTNAVLALDPQRIGLRGSPTQVKKIFAPQRMKGEIIAGDGTRKQQAVEAILDRLIDWGFVRVGDND